MWSSRKIVFASVLIAVASAGIGPVHAVDETCPTSTNAYCLRGVDDDPDRLYWAYAPTPTEWTPQGEIIVDSGFAAIRDSFAFFNYGQRLGKGNALLGYSPYRFASGLTPESMTRMFGSDVACAHYSKDESGQTTCVPKPAISEFMEAANTEMWGGHCFGVAALVAQLFNGQLERSRLTDAQINSAISLDPSVQGELAYWWATQVPLTSFANKITDPLSVVEDLTTHLKPGELPYILLLTFEYEGHQAGHAITPHAIYQRPNGDYDIAVYDNNYPLRTRAIHVDATDNSFEYLIEAKPGEEPVYATGDATNTHIGLLNISAIQGTLECSFCDGRQQIVDLGANDPVPSNVTMKISDLDGSKIEGLEKIPNLNPTAGQLPAYRMPPGTNFKLEVNNTANDSQLSGSIHTFIGDGTVLDAKPVIPAGAVLTMEVRAQERQVSLQTTKPSAPHYLQAAVERSGDDYNAWFIPDAKRPASAGATFTMIEDDGVTEYTFNGTESMRVNVVAQRVRSKGTTPGAHTPSGVLMQPGDTLRINIRNWVGSGGVPKLIHIKTDGTQRTVTMKRGLGPKENLVLPQPS